MAFEVVNRMDNIDAFIEHVQHICEQPRMWVVGGSFYEVCAYISGYSHAIGSPLKDGGWKAFQSFVCARCICPDKIVWPCVLKKCSRDEQEATTRLKDLLIEFAEKCKTMSHADIVREAVSEARSKPESEPVKTWRRFSRAIRRNRREDVVPLIQDHPDAGVLWSTHCPSRVAPQLDQIQESYLISPISGSEDEGEVTLLTPDFGVVGVKRIDGIWRVDASAIIASRKRSWNRDATIDERG
jgi:hypothetical protein